jgi:ribonuclease BN (tRNA processing enzyme)
LRVLGGCGAWPAAGQACSGYLVDHDGFQLLVDPGYAILPRLLEISGAEDIGGVLVSHGHPDHCADLHPLLRARAFRDDPAAPLAVYALADSVSKVLALDRPGVLEDAYTLREFSTGRPFTIGPFEVETWLLPHFVPNAGLRLTAGGKTLAYTGDTGPSSDLLDLAREADLFLAEATFPHRVPPDSMHYLSSACQAGKNAARADVGYLLLTHLLPGSDPSAAEEAARRSYDRQIAVARGGFIIDLDQPRGGEPTNY